MTPAFTFPSSAGAEPPSAGVLRDVHMDCYSQDGLEDELDRLEEVHPNAARRHSSFSSSTDSDETVSNRVKRPITEDGVDMENDDAHDESRDGLVPGGSRMYNADNERISTNDGSTLKEEPPPSRPNMKGQGYGGLYQHEYNLKKAPMPSPPSTDQEGQRELYRHAYDFKKEPQRFPPSPNREGENESRRHEYGHQLSDIWSASRPLRSDTEPDYSTAMDRSLMLAPLQRRSTDVHHPGVQLPPLLYHLQQRHCRPSTMLSSPTASTQRFVDSPATYLSSPGGLSPIDSSSSATLSRPSTSNTMISDMSFVFNAHNTRRAMTLPEPVCNNSRDFADCRGPVQFHFKHDSEASSTLGSRTPHSQTTLDDDTTPQDLSSSSVSRQNSGVDNGEEPSNAGFRCDHANCTAGAFATQYLLSSHRNVHSSERPHFCPVPGCKRGPHGKGFKRKNEKNRHQLVHDSPGYICPWCPDQSHTYPRPDNLQRHAALHHKDKDKDDPELREVLAKKPAGMGAGSARRRRGT